MTPLASKSGQAGSGAKRWFLLAVLFVGAVVLRVGVESWMELNAGREAEAAGEHYVAALHYERAVHWHLPSSPTVEAAANNLDRLAAEALSRGDEELALWSLRSLRSGLLATRSFYTPLASRIPTLEERIAAIIAATPGQEWNDGEIATDTRAAEVLTTLRSRSQPAPGWVVLMLASWLVWLGAAWHLFVNCVRPAGGWYRRRAMRTLATLVVGHGVWIVGLLNA